MYLAVPFEFYRSLVLPFSCVFLAVLIDIAPTNFPISCCSFNINDIPSLIASVPCPSPLPYASSKRTQRGYVRSHDPISFLPGWNSPGESSCRYSAASKRFLMVRCHWTQVVALRRRSGGKRSRCHLLRRVWRARMAYVRVELLGRLVV